MPLSVPRTYAELRSGVQAALLAGQREVERAKVMTYWETGRLINEHILLNSARADYGAQVFTRLERDLDVTKRTLYQCAQFARLFPIVHARAQLSWVHYRTLCQVEDEAHRQALSRAAIKQEWTSAQLEARVRELNMASGSNGSGNHAVMADTSKVEPPELLKPRRGTPGLHPVVDRGDGPVVDLGFKLFRALGPSKIAVGDIVRFTDDGARRIDGATKAELFTYTAMVRRVVDGDTFIVALMVAPGITLELKLRLRGLDCPETSTPAGRAAKRFVEEFVRAGEEVVLSTTKPDKYDRYLADIFVRQSDDGRTTDDRSKTEIFLNNAILEVRHGVRYDGVGPKEE